MTVVGVLHPGEMGAVVAGALRERGETVLWASAGRSAATAGRAEAAGLEDAGDIAEVCRRCEILLSICPPHAAVEVARAASGFAGIYVDANAIAPDTARAIARLQPRLVDGGIVGPPPTGLGRRGSTSPARRRNASPRSSQGRTSRRESFLASPVRRRR